MCVELVRLTLKRLGIIHRCVGFVKKQQALKEESFNAYLSALKNFRVAVGNKSSYVSQVCSHLGAYHAERKEYETARYSASSILGSKF